MVKLGNIYCNKVDKLNSHIRLQNHTVRKVTKGHLASKIYLSSYIHSKAYKTGIQTISIKSIQLLHSPVTDIILTSALVVNTINCFVIIFAQSQPICKSQTYR